MLKNVYRVKIEGLNLDRLINFIKNNYKASNIVRVSYNELLIDLSYNSYNNLLLKIDTSCYNVTIQKVYGINKILHIFKQNIALFVSAIICLSAILFLNTRLLKINIYGAQNSTKVEILNYLKSKNINVFNSNNISLNNLEQQLLENVSNISMVSAVINGNVLVINVKEKLPQIVQNYADFVAPYNLVIESIMCYQGTKLKNVGDIVKKGESIVASYITQENGEKINVEPLYNVTATTYFTGSVQFKNIQTKLVKTGKKIVNSSYTMFGKNFLKINKKCNFTYFEEEHKNIKLFNNLFIPITVNKHIYYELKQVTYTYNFENEKEKLFKESLNIANSNVPLGVVVNNTTQEVVNMGDYLLIQTYLQAKVNLTND